MRTPPLPDTAPEGEPARSAAADHAEPPTERPAADLAARLADVVGAAHVLVDPDVVAGYTTDWTRRFSGPATLVVRPGSTAEVASVLAECDAGGIPVVVQGGKTGLVGGSVPPPAGAAGADGPLQAAAPVVLSTARLSAIGEVDTVAGQVTAGAGATLAAVQATARAAGFEFPVDLGARDSATVGGMVATNAGGVHVLRYGAMRQQVLGSEVALADGTVLSHMGGLIKDNTGYDLSQLMVGSEGTLGVVTAVRLRLVPHPAGRAVVVVGVDSTAEACALVTVLRRDVGGLSAAELFFQEGLDLVCEHAHLEPPFPARRPAYLLAEATGRGDVAGELVAALAEAGIDDEATAVADDEAGAKRLWAFRERHPETVSSIGIPHKLDITVSLGGLPDFAAAVRREVERVWPGATVYLWGHVGDGNLHVNVLGPPPDDESVDHAVLALAARHGGSISAEHGIGRAKAPWLELARSPAEVAAMRAVKNALDPRGILNPGVLFQPVGEHTGGEGAQDDDA